MSTSTRMLGFALLLAGLAPAAQAAPPPVIVGKFAPKDECARAPGAAAFRAALAEAVRKRDVAALVALADKDVKLDFGGGEGQAEFRQRLTGPEGAELWRELADMLPLGCAVDEGELVLPWFFAQTIDSEDPYALMLVAGDRVPLLPKADAAAAPVKLLSWALVEPEEGYDERAEFQPVRVIDTDLSGFVAAASLRSMIGYRLTARRVGGAWKIASFIAGD